MAVYSKQYLSGSPSGGKGIQVTGLPSTSWTTIHTNAAAAAGVMEEVWIWAQNNATAARTIGLGWGSTGAADKIQMSVPSMDGLYLVSPGLLLATGQAVQAFVTDATFPVSLHGFANRISPT